MKKTLLFSNVIGDIFVSNPEKMCFNQYMNEYLLKNVDNAYSMLFVNAPGLGNEENYLPNIIRCFENINIKFSKILDVEKTTIKQEVERFLNENDKIIFFLMGGNPIAQMEIIDKLELRKVIRNHNDLVIGFCAGAINLSKKSIITTDDDFSEMLSYDGIARVSIIVESHYNQETNEKRNNELKYFAKQFNSKIFALPDESIIVFENDKINELGRIYYFE